MSRKFGNWTIGVAVHPQAPAIVHALFREMRAQKISRTEMHDRTGVRVHTLHRWSKEPRCTICTRQMAACLEVVGMSMSVVRVARHEGAGA